MAPGRRRVMWFRRPCEIVMGSIWSLPAMSMCVLSIAMMQGRSMSKPAFFIKASYVFL